jgi:small GTP-binding protein
MQSIKIVVVGDGAVGKTSFLISFTMMAFPTEYVPTTFDNFNAVYEFEGAQIFLGLWDTAGQAEFEKMRPMSYKESDVYLLFFSVVNPTSLENIKLRWVEEIRFHSPTAPLFLVGTQTDSREDEEIILDLQSKGKEPVSAREAQEVAREIGAVSYFEISARNMEFGGIFDELIRYEINVHRCSKRKGKFCWSIHCRQKLTAFNQVKCKDCGNAFCQDCIEIWENGYRGCPHCCILKKRAKEKEGKEVRIRKPRKSPEEKLREKEEKFKRKIEKQMKNNKFTPEEIEAMLEQATSDEDSSKKKRNSDDDE